MRKPIGPPRPKPKVKPRPKQKGLNWKESKFKGEYTAKIGNFQFIACSCCYDISYYNGKTINELESGSVKTLRTAKNKCERWLEKLKSL